MGNIGLEASLPPVQAGAGILRARLKAETRQEHLALEMALDLLRPELNVADYCAVLTRLYMFHAAFEDCLSRQKDLGCRAARFYFSGRIKQQWLADDLQVLGMGLPAHEIMLPHLEWLLASAENRWGALYVLEGSTLGGAVISKHFMKKFGMTADTGIRFFTGYGADTGLKWTAMLQQLQECETQAISQNDIVEGAKRTFKLLKAHLVA